MSSIYGCLWGFVEGWNQCIDEITEEWLYFVKFEGMTEEEAKAMVKEAQPDEPKLFGDE